MQAEFAIDNDWNRTAVVPVGATEAVRFMEEVTLESAPVPLRDMFRRGFTALERGNLNYAIDMFSHCVEKEPQFLQARRFLRAAEIKRLLISGKPNPVIRGIAALRGVPGYLAAAILLKSGKEMEALRAAEKLMRIDPLNMMFVKLLGQAAEAADMPEIAIQTLAMVREQCPDNAELMNQLGALYMKTNQTELARECFEKLCDLRPNDGGALKALKDAEAIHSMSRDGWVVTAAAGGSFRNMIKDEKEAEVLEKDSKAVKTEADVEALIAESLAKIGREPDNVNYRRGLANLYSSVKRFPEAIEALKEAQRVAGGRDPQLDSAMSYYRIQQYNMDIEQLRSRGDQAGASRLEQERDAFAFEDIKERVARYPNELQLRFEYGEKLFRRELINEAVQQFQLAQRNAQRRIKSLYYIGLCFKLKKQYDLAVSQFEQAAAEQATMDDTKKDILYELGLVLEAAGNPQKAMEHYKRIYQADIGYKDIAARIEKGYRSPGAPA